MDEMPWRERDTSSEDWGLAELQGWKGELDDDDADPDTLAELVDTSFVGVDAVNWRVPLDRVRELLLASLDEGEIVEVPVPAPQYVAYKPHPDDPLPDPPQRKKPRLGIEELELPR